MNTKTTKAQLQELCEDLMNDNDSLQIGIENYEAEAVQARQSTEFWKKRAEEERSAHLSCLKTIETLQNMVNYFLESGDDT